MDVSAHIRHRPIAAFWVVAVGLELLLIPLFLLTGADAAIERGLAEGGIAFNTDLVTAARVVMAAPDAVWGVALSLAQVASPDLAVLAVCAFGLGRAELGIVRRRFRAWSPAVGARKGLLIWATMLALFCVMNLASAALHSTAPGDMAFRWDPDPLTLGFLGALLVAMFLDAGALLEENGWRGFALPRLQRSHGPLGAAVIVGVLWGLWHLPVKFDVFLEFGLARGLLLFSVLLAKFVALSVVMSYFFNRAGEATVLAIAMHGLSNDSVRLGGLLESETFAAQLRSELHLLLPILVVAVLLIAATRGQLGTGPWHDGRMRSVVFRPLTGPQAVRRLAVSLSAAATGAVYLVLLGIAVPVITILCLVVVGVPLLLGLLVVMRGITRQEARFAITLGADVPTPTPAPPDLSIELVARARHLLTSGTTWRACGWIAVRGVTAVTVVLALLSLVLIAIALAAIPFADRYLSWGTWATSSGWTSAWTLLLLPLPVLAAAHVLEVQLQVLGAAAPRLLGPDPAQELAALRLRERDLRDRNRLAAELHDTVGHTLTVVTMQAVAAARAVDDDPAFVKQALGAIEHAGRSATEELDSMLGALADRHTELPQPRGVDAFPELVAAMRAAGAWVEFRTEGPLDAIPPDLGAELLRIAQEACANVLRHAGGAATVIELTTTREWARLSVRNEPGERQGASPRIGGRGLPSIERRAQRFGGTAAMTPTDAGGYVVRVDVPVGVGP